MHISELVEQHGVPIRVTCNQRGHPPFQVLERLDNDEFRVEYPDGTEGVVTNCLGDYELIQEPSMVPVS